MTQPKTYTLTLPAVPPGAHSGADVRAFRDAMAGEITTLTDFLLAACRLANEHFNADTDPTGVETWALEALNEDLLFPLDLTAEDLDKSIADDLDAGRRRGIVQPGRLL